MGFPSALPLSQTLRANAGILRLQSTPSLFAKLSGQLFLETFPGKGHAQPRCTFSSCLKNKREKLVSPPPLGPRPTRTPQEILMRKPRPRGTRLAFWLNEMDT